MKRLGLVFLLLSFALNLVFIGCAEKRPDKPINADRYRISKSVFKNTRYHMNETVTQAPLWSEGQPGYQSNTSRLVRFKFTEDYLYLVEVNYDHDLYLSSNTSAATEKLLSRFPVRHVDVRRSKDSYGDETNVYVETTEDNSWENRHYAVINFEAEEVLDRSYAYLQNSRLTFQDYTSELSNAGEVSELVVNEGIINITSEKRLSQSGAKRPIIIKVRYSFMPERKSGYTPKPYSKEWEKRAGYFKTVTKTRDKKTSRKYLKTFLNRFNPKQRVTYYLSPSWNDGEIAKFKHVAYKAVDEWNKVFKKATGIDNYIILKESNGDQTMGDLRYNMVNFISEPFLSAPLGYGPSVVHPETGEIINANVNIYANDFRWSAFTKDYYTFDEDEEHDHADTANEVSSTALSTELGSVLSSIIPDRVQDLASNFRVVNEQALEFDSEVDEVLQKMQKREKGFLQLLEKGAHRASACNNKYHSSIKAEKGAVTGQTRDEIIENMLLSTLIHEFGHNFGLRHNFMGSYDKDNFPKEIAEDGDHRFHSSSIMDYTNDYEHDLLIVGPYDEAIIMFGYSDQKQYKKAKPTSFKDFPFLYCTDGFETYQNPYCNKFDSGTSAEEIALNYAKDYHKWYKYRNLPHELHTRHTYDFSPASYENSLFYGYFVPLRAPIEFRKEIASYSQERLLTKFSLAKPKEEIMEDLMKASLVSYRFLLSALYNGHDDLNKVNEYDEIEEVGTSIDRKLALRFLTMESIGLTSGVATYNALLDEAGLPKNAFFEHYSHAVLGDFKRYDFFKSSNDKIDAGFVVDTYKDSEGKDREKSYRVMPSVRKAAIQNLLAFKTEGSVFKNQAIAHIRNSKLSGSAHKKLIKEITKDLETAKKDLESFYKGFSLNSKTLKDEVEAFILTLGEEPDELGQKKIKVAKDFLGFLEYFEDYFKKDIPTPDSMDVLQGNYISFLATIKGPVTTMDELMDKLTEEEIKRINEIDLFNKTYKEDISDLEEELEQTKAKVLEDEDSLVIYSSVYPSIEVNSDSIIATKLAYSYTKYSKLLGSVNSAIVKLEEKVEKTKSDIKATDELLAELEASAEPNEEEITELKKEKTKLLETLQSTDATIKEYGTYIPVFEKLIASELDMLYYLADSYDLFVK